MFDPSTASLTGVETAPATFLDVLFAGIALWQVLAGTFVLIIIYAVASIIVSEVVRPAIQLQIRPAPIDISKPVGAPPRFCRSAIVDRHPAALDSHDS